MTITSGPRQSDGPMVFVDSLVDPELADDDRHHLTRVLRVRPGSPLILCDGAGGWVPALFDDSLTQTEVVQHAPVERPFGIGFALTKGDRPELVVQKLTELGAAQIAPFVSDRCVVRWDESRAARQHQRFVRVAREASMQCRRTVLPEIFPLRSLADVTSTTRVVIADLDGELSLTELARRDIEAGRPMPFVLIGPEGGWSDDERASMDCEYVRFARNVLRAETAAIAAAVVLDNVRLGYADRTTGTAESR